MVALKIAFMAALVPLALQLGLVSWPVLILQTARERMRSKLATEAGKAVYRRRKAIVEPVNGAVKEVQRVRSFLLRGLEKVTGEWNLVAACHNLLKIFRHAGALPVLR